MSSSRPRSNARDGVGVDGNEYDMVEGASDYKYDIVQDVGSSSYDIADDVLTNEYFMAASTYACDEYGLMPEREDRYATAPSQHEYGAVVTGTGNVSKLLGLEHGDVAGAQRNELIQNIAKEPATNPFEQQEKATRYQRQLDTFLDAARATVPVILREHSLESNDKRSIKCLSEGDRRWGQLGGAKYKQDGIFYKLAVPLTAKSTPYVAYKVQLSEFRANSWLQSAAFTNVAVANTAIFSMKGRTVVAQVCLPISPLTLVYGSSDAGRTVKTGGAAEKIAEAIARELHLVKHRVGPKGENETWLAVDAEIHVGGDGRFYLADTGRLLPPTSQLRVYHELFRPEFMRLHCKEPLSCDQFTAFGRHDAADLNARGQRAVRHLIKNVIPRVALELQPGSDLSAVLHEAGINMRFLGLLLVHIEKEDVRAHVLREMTARSFKEQLYNAFADEPFDSENTRFREVAQQVLDRAPEDMPSWLRKKFFLQDAEMPSSEELREALSAETAQAVVEKLLTLQVRTMGLPPPTERVRAEQILREELSVRAQNLSGGANDPRLASTQRNLLELYRRWKGNQRSAEETAARAQGILDWMKRVITDDLDERALCEQSAGLYYLQHGRYAEGYEAFRVAIDSLPPAKNDDKDALSTRATLLNSIGNALVKLGRLDEALEQYRAAKNTRELLLGADHPHVALTLNNMAIVFKNQGKYDDAHETYKRVLKIREAKLGADHPSVAQTLNNMAVVLKNKGQHDAALQLWTRALKIREAKLGADHPDVANTLNNMANGFWASGNFHEAKQHCERAILIKRDQLGPSHPSVGQSLQNLGNILRDLGERDGAQRAYEECLSIRKAQLGPNHPSCASTMSNLAVLAEDRDDPETALQLLNEACAILMNTYGPDKPHPTVARTLGNLGNVLRNADKIDQAVVPYREALEIREALGNKRDIGEAANNLGVAYWHLGKLELALAYLGQALSSYEDIDDPKLKRFVPRIMSNIASILHAHGDRERESLEMYERSLHAFLARDGGSDAAEPSPDVLATLENMAAIYSALDEPDKAVQLYVQALGSESHREVEALKERLKTVEQLRRHQGCSYVVTKKQYAIQFWRRCETCSADESVGVCMRCAERCHAGHVLGDVRQGSFYCDCGAGELPTACQFVKSFMSRVTSKLIAEDDQKDEGEEPQGRFDAGRRDLDSESDDPADDEHPPHRRLQLAHDDGREALSSEDDDL